MTGDLFLPPSKELVYVAAAPVRRAGLVDGWERVSAQRANSNGALWRGGEPGDER